MPISCDPEDLAEAAKGFQDYNQKQIDSVQTYLLALIAGVDPDPSALSQAAKEFQGLSPLQHQQVQDYLLCQIANQ